ncbi:MAG: TIGR04002 family protein [Lachnospiraceae bacterium]|nr:TIGR04002 family protein [Lachnospiraceae bacterium]
MVNNEKNRKIKYMCLAGVLTALVFVFTAYLQVPSATGYVHLGDGFICFASCILPLPYALFVGAGGALLADCLTGYAIWAPGSAVIKALMVLCFSRKGKHICSGRNLLALLPAAALCVGGYYLYGAFLAGSFASPVTEIPGNIMQSVCSAVIFVILAIITDKIKIKRYL